MNVLISAGTTPKDAEFPWNTFNAVAPHLIWFLFFVCLLRWLGRRRIFELLDRVQKVNIGGVEVELRQTLKDAAAKRQEVIPTIAIGRASRRLARSGDLIRGARILWIDDNPENNTLEISLFEEAGAEVDTTDSSELARTMLAQARYDLILSDIARKADTTAGLVFAKELAQNPKSPPLVIYVAEAQKPLPDGTFGITDRPDELVHLVLDALARKRG